MRLGSPTAKTSILVLFLALGIVMQPTTQERAYGDESDDEEVSETVIVYSKKKKERNGACASCGSITFRIPSPALAERRKPVTYETSRKPNEADAALLYQCASLLEQIQQASIGAWYRPGGRVSKAADERNQLIEQFDEMCGDLLPNNPGFGADVANDVAEYMNR